MRADGANSPKKPAPTVDFVDVGGALHPVRLPKNPGTWAKGFTM